MSEDRNYALRKLAEHLASLNAGVGSALPREGEMLDQIVSGILNGEDIARRFPEFHQKLLESAALREAFLDVLASIEAERSGEMTPLPSKARTDLSFLTGHASPSVLEVLDLHRWRASWQKSLDQLQAIFSPRKLVYRADPLIQDPWFTLLREEVTAAEGTNLDVELSCTLADQEENTLAAFLNLAVMLETPSAQAPFPLRASLQWGEYLESVLLTEEGRVKFPDIPLTSIFDPTLNQLRDGLNLSIETTSA